MAKTITFNELRRIKDSLPDGATHQIADKQIGRASCRERV